MAGRNRDSRDYPYSADDVGIPASQAESIAAANANESMLLPHRSDTPRIVTPNEEDGSTPPHHANPSRTSPATPGDDTSTISELDAGEVPPPAYSESHNQIRLSQAGLATSAQLQDDGRINIDIKGDSPFISNVLMPALRRSMLYEGKQTTSDLPPGYIPPSLGGDSNTPPPPPLNVVIHVVGSRGDVQPFVALGKVLKETYGHRVRLATHGTFRNFVTENGLEFFSIGGDPAELMAFMVKHPSLMPGTEALLNGDIRKRRKGMYEIVQGCWRSCYETGDGTDLQSTDNNTQENFQGSDRPFVADAIIANPPSFAHIHCAEKLGIPLHLMFTMPWSPTQSFPHPLANIQRSSADASMTNFLSYTLVELMTWQGLGDIINRFREKFLGLEPLSLMWAPALASRLQVPFTYCWSPALIPKPKDWGAHINVSGFFFLSLASNYEPAAELQRFLDAGPPPVYIGFGSIVVDDPNEMTNLIFEAVRLSGQRALVSKGWGGFGAEDLTVPENIFMLGNVPHDWLFQHVSCVVHHGGAGTTSAGISQGCPTVVVPFFGDQPFWGAMIARAGAGPDPIPSKELTAEKLADGIKTALSESCVQKAKDLASSIAHEKGSDLGASYFHRALDIDKMRCSLAPSRTAVWQIKRTNVKLSALAAAVIGQARQLDFADLRLHRTSELNAEETPYEPIGGAATALVGTAGSMMMGLADIPTDVWRAIAKKSTKEQDGESVPDSTSAGEGSSRDTLSDSVTSLETRTLSSETTPSLASDLHPETTSTVSLSSGRRTSTGDGLSSPRAKSPSRAQTGNKSPSSPGRQPITMETALDTTRGIGRFTEATLKSPMDFTLALAKGFRNAPKLYGETPRPSTRVTGIQSGLKASAKDFGYGMYDGITGFFTQPVQGASKEGTAGFLKGFGRGLAGITLKPMAAFWALPGYTFQGIYKEIKKSNGASLQNYIIAARTAQGFEDWNSSTPEERNDILARWDAMQDDIRKQKKRWYSKNNKKKGDEQVGSEMRSQDMPASTTPIQDSLRGTNEQSTQQQDTTEANPPSGDAAEYEEAIRRSILETSSGDAEEDAMVERAIRQSLMELQNRPPMSREEEARAQSIRGDISRAQGQRDSPQSDRARHQQDGADEGDEELRRAIAASQEKTREEKEEELELARAMYESRKAHTEQQKAQDEEDAVVEYIKRQTLTENPR